MKHIKTMFVSIVLCCMVASFLPLSGWSFEPIPESYTPPHPKTYIPNITEILDHKQQYDDPRPFVTTIGPKQVLPPDLYEKLVHDIEEMKTLWAEIVGFRSPDAVGKIAPEIKPGKYNYKDKENYPGLKELMWPLMYEQRFNPGGPPHAGNIPEFELVPTKQYYLALPIAVATKRNAGKTKLDNDGYIEWKTWEAGYPFPRPSGEFKAQQIVYNMEKKYNGFGENDHIFSWWRGVTRDLKQDFDGVYDVSQLRLAGRCLMPPYGYYDEVAKERGEIYKYIFGFHSPRDIAGTAQCGLSFTDPKKMDQMYIYIPSLRRIRKMSTTDTQDPIMGMDQIYDDREGFRQKLTPFKYPYKYELLEDREYLCAEASEDGAEYFSSEGLEIIGMKFQRRPIYVVKLTQLDKNYIYGHRIFFIDKETFNFHHAEHYDQKGRLYRTFDHPWSFFPKMGLFSWGWAPTVGLDHIDAHSTLGQSFEVPAFFTRADISLKGVLRRGK